MVGWNSFMYVRNCWSFSMPWVRIANMSCMNLIHSIGMRLLGAFWRSFLSSIAMNMFAHVGAMWVAYVGVMSIIDCSDSGVIILFSFNISIQAWMPWSLGMLVYKLLTSIVTSMMFFGKLVFNVKILRRKYVVSCMYDGMWLRSGLRRWSAYWDSLTVGPPQPEIMGRPGMSCLWILGKRYKCGVLACESDVRNLCVVLSIMLDLYKL